MVSIWDKIGVAVKKGVKVTGNVAALVPQMLTYPVRKSNASWGQIKHDTKVALKEAVGMNVPEEEREYDPPIETTKASENFGVEIKEQKEKGKIAFLASRTLTGDIPYLNDVQLCKIKAGFPNITIFREENKVVIEVDVESIIKKVKEDSPVADEKTIKKLVLEGIYNEVDRNFKGLANITGGELKIHTDRKLLHGIAEKLYKEYSNQTDSKKSMSEEKLSQVIKELGNEFLSLADASGETIKPLSTPTVKEGVSDETIKSL